MPRRAFLLLFVALAAVPIGGRFVWAIDQPNQEQHISDANPSSAGGAEDHQPTKTIRERLSVIWDRTWDDPVAFYTFVLGIFTALVAIVSATQIIFLIRTDKVTRISANAAQKSAEALPQSSAVMFSWNLIIPGSNSDL